MRSPPRPPRPALRFEPRRATPSRDRLASPSRSKPRPPIHALRAAPGLAAPGRSPTAPSHRATPSPRHSAPSQSAPSHPSLDRQTRRARSVQHLASTAQPLRATPCQSLCRPRLAQSVLDRPAFPRHAVPVRASPRQPRPRLASSCLAGPCRVVPRPPFSPSLAPPSLRKPLRNRPFLPGLTRPRLSPSRHAVPVLDRPAQPHLTPHRLGPSAPASPRPPRRGSPRLAIPGRAHPRPPSRASLSQASPCQSRPIPDRQPRQFCPDRASPGRASPQLAMSVLDRRSKPFRPCPPRHVGPVPAPTAPPVPFWPGLAINSAPSHSVAVRAMLSCPLLDRRSETSHPRPTRRAGPVPAPTASPCRFIPRRALARRAKPIPRAPFRDRLVAPGPASPKAQPRLSIPKPTRYAAIAASRSSPVRSSSDASPTASASKRSTCAVRPRVPASDKHRRNEDCTRCNSITIASRA